MNADVVHILAIEPTLTFVLFATESVHSDEQWYAAFREEYATELTPERGYGYGGTAEEAIRSAVGDFRNNEERR